MLLVDAANVVGSRPTGWWRDRAGAATDLVARIRDAVAAAALVPPVVVVLEGQARSGAAEEDEAGVAVVHAAGHGDDTIVALAAGSSEAVILVSADRELRDRCRAAGAQAVGPAWLLDRLLGR